MLYIRNLTYHPAAAAQPILTNINLDLAPQQLGLIVGQSGSGKTTLLEILAGLAEPNRGQILWRDQLLTSLHLQQLAGLVFQFPERHFCGHNVLTELRLGHPELSTTALDQALDSVGLSTISRLSPPQSLSGGQQRRLALAVQLVRQPHLLLLDEPTAGLDWSMRQQLVSLLQQLKQRWTLLIVTHDAGDLEPIADRIWRMKAGVLSEG
jgi:energy-coupling factor transport system ATP-binding protein